ncbi:MAG TPA: DUF559 domain-containing protein [Actinomycetales bacterium]|nr:DUF559 domain-containing protein [Actinomycetales bacterium]
MKTSELLVQRLLEGPGAQRYGDLARTRGEERALAQLVDSGVVNKSGYGCYALPDTPLPVQIATLLKGKITCVSAAEVAGLRILARPNKIHIALPRDRGIKLPRPLTQQVVVHREPDHWASALSGLRPHESLPAPLAPLPAVFARIAICQPLRAAVVALDSGLNRGLVHKDEIARFLYLPRHKHAMKALNLASPTSQSVLESLARLELVAAGLKVEPQAPIDTVGFVDLLVENFIVVELDGFSYHGDRAQFLRDRFRDRQLTKLNYRVLRFAYDEVIRHPEFVVEEVRRVLQAQKLKPAPNPAIPPRPLPTPAALSHPVPR